jgi:uncharacterized protein YdaT
MNIKRFTILPEEVKEWFKSASNDDINDFLNNGLHQLIVELEADDFFGTEGFNKRFA